jgi:hypothetical protein
MVIHHLAEVRPSKDPTDVNNNAYHMHKQGQNYGLNYHLHACEYDTCMTTQPNKAGITALTIAFMLVSTILV